MELQVKQPQLRQSLVDCLVYLEGSSSSSQVKNVCQGDESGHGCAEDHNNTIDGLTPIVIVLDSQYLTTKHL